MEKVLELKNIKKSYPGVVALKSVSFSVSKGAVHGFVGPDGAGKSTAMRIISGLLNSDSGELSLAANLKIGILPEVPPLYVDMKVEAYLMFVYEIQTLGVLSKKEKQSKINEIMEKTGISNVKNRLIGNLSKGYKQRVGIASVLVFSPELILLDEPMSGLDPKSIVEIRNLILDLKKDYTIFLSSHRLHELDLLCSEVTIINNGEILASGPIDKIKSKFSGTSTIEMEIEGWTSELSEQMEQVLNIKVESSSPKYSIISDRDVRRELSSFIFENGGVILSMHETKMELEDIFRSYTEDQQ